MTDKLSVLDSLNADSKKLDKISWLTKKTITKFKEYNKKDCDETLTQRELDVMKEVLTECLIMTSELSTKIDDVKTSIDDHYTLTYVHSPALGRKLYYDHYFKLHKPYDTIKKSIWGCFEKMDIYIENKL